MEPEKASSQNTDGSPEYHKAGPNIKIVNADLLVRNNDGEWVPL